MSTIRTAARVSARGLDMPASPIRKLMPLADEAKKRGVTVYHLNIGQPDLETPEPMRRRLTTLKDKVYAYSPSNGTPEYLDFLHAYYGKLGIDAEAERGPRDDRRQRGAALRVHGLRGSGRRDPDGRAALHELPLLRGDGGAQRSARS